MQKSTNHLDRVLLSLLLLLPLTAWLSTHNNLIDYLSHETPPGQILYVLSKLFGLYALLTIWLHISWALLGKTPLAKILPRWNAKRHRNMGFVSLVLMVLHAGLFIAAVSSRKGDVAWELLLPVFGHGHYRLMLSLGVVGLWFLVLIVMAGVGLIKNTTNRKLRWLHHLAIPFLVLVYVHGLYIGSETKNGFTFIVYVVMGSALPCFLALRIYYRNKVRKRFT